MAPNVIFEQSRHLYNRIQHEPMLQTMKDIVSAQQQYHKRFNDISAHQMPQSSKLLPLLGHVKPMPWISLGAPNKVVESYTIEGNKSAFVIKDISILMVMEIWPPMLRHTVLLLQKGQQSKI